MQQQILVRILCIISFHKTLFLGIMEINISIALEDHIFHLLREWKKWLQKPIQDLPDHL